MAATKKPPWFVKNDTDERNQKAKNAYTALLQVVARQPEDEEYRRFSEEVSSTLAGHVQSEKANSWRLLTWAENNVSNQSIDSGWISFAPFLRAHLNATDAKLAFFLFLRQPCKILQRIRRQALAC